MKYFFISLFIMLSVQSYAQLSVESIQSDTDMNKFMEANYFKGAKRDTVVRYGIVTSYYDTTFAISYDSAFIAHLESLKSPKWIKADLNKDGKADLLLSVSLNESSRVFAFISKKDGTYYSQKLSLDNNQYGQYFIKYDTSKGFIELGVADPDMSDNGEMSADSSSRIRIDTIMFKNGLFVDYDMGDKPLNTIDTFKISFAGSFPSPFGTQRIMIPRNGNVQFTRLGTDSSGNDAILLFTMDWDKAAKDSFFSFVDRLNLANYKDKYNPLWKVSYGSVIRTEIVFADSTSKKIRDHGEVVPIGLLHLYEIVDRLKETDKWIYAGPYKGQILAE